MRVLVDSGHRRFPNGYCHRGHLWSKLRIYVRNQPGSIEEAGDEIASRYDYTRLDIMTPGQLDQSNTWTCNPSILPHCG